MITQEDEHKKRIAEFLKELNQEIEANKNLRNWNSGFHQVLVIGAAIAGFGSLAAGTIGHSAEWAGIIGALTSVAAILAKQLHCVKAVNWRGRMAVELDAIRLQLLYEYHSAPNPTELASLSEQLRQVNFKMNDAWEKIASAESANLGEVPKHHPKNVPEGDPSTSA